MLAVATRHGARAAPKLDHLFVFLPFRFVPDSVGYIEIRCLARGARQGALRYLRIMCKKRRATLLKRKAAQALPGRASATFNDGTIEGS